MEIKYTELMSMFGKPGWEERQKDVDCIAFSNLAVFGTTCSNIDKVVSYIVKNEGSLEECFVNPKDLYDI